MPSNLKPMLATLVDDPFDNPDWLFEIKWDGYRAVAEISGSEINLHSRNNKSFNKQFSPVYESLKKINTDMILDGEVVVVDDEGRADFQLLQSYQKTGKGNLVYYVFDILYYNGYDLKNLPLVKRKEILRKVLPDIKNIVYSDHIEGQGKAFFNLAEEKNIEGIIAKNSNSLYIPAKRSKEWLKIKTSKTQEGIICGFTKPKGSRKNFGALILGVYKDKELIYIGHTGGGFKESDLEIIKDKLDPLIRRTSPFKELPATNTPVTWVEPKLICEVQFSEWTDEGLMRHPVFQKLREDKNPREVKFEVEKDVDEVTEKKSAGKKIDVEKKRIEKHKGPDVEVDIDGHRLKLTNLDKVFWPEEGYTKGDLLEYYEKVADIMVPYLKGRPESLNRHPNGIYGKSFYQKDVGTLPPKWIETKIVYSDTNDKQINYLICNKKADLIYLANLGCIEINPWFSRIENLENPDYFVIDLDPVEIAFDKVIETALVVKEVLDKAGAESYCKTSGATGMHVYVPLGAKYPYEIARNFAHVICKIVNNKIPEITSLERNPSKRKHKVYLDYLQNRTGQTLAAPYSVRPRPGATVSTPLKWTEVREGITPEDFTIKNIIKRLEKTGDIFNGVLGKGIEIEKSIKKLEKL